MVRYLDMGDVCSWNFIVIFLKISKLLLNPNVYRNLVCLSFSVKACILLNYSFIFILEVMDFHYIPDDIVLVPPWFVLTLQIFYHHVSHWTTNLNINFLIMAYPSVKSAGFLANGLLFIWYTNINTYTWE